jgi:hypothetical protein
VRAHGEHTRQPRMRLVAGFGYLLHSLTIPDSLACRIRSFERTACGFPRKAG